MFERFSVIDADTHITEPPDTWTARVSGRWGEAIPHIERINRYDVWVIAGKPWAKPGNTAMAGFDGVLPDGPATYEDMHPAAWDPKARIAFMDEQHIYAQVLYPRETMGSSRSGAMDAKSKMSNARAAGIASSRHQPRRLRVSVTLPEASSSKPVSSAIAGHRAKRCNTSPCDERHRAYPADAADDRSVRAELNGDRHELRAQGDGQRIPQRGRVSEAVVPHKRRWSRLAWDRRQAMRLLTTSGLDIDPGAAHVLEVDHDRRTPDGPRSQRVGELDDPLVTHGFGAFGEDFVGL
jgi:hypothetical protein